MKNALQLMGIAALLGGLIALSGGCEADVEGPGPVVYGDVGYVGPWYYPGTWFGGRGGNYAHPPYGGGGRGPSIPDHPRPSGGSGHSGGGAVHGGGGGAVHSGGGGGDRRH